MGDEIRVMIVGSPYRMPRFRSLARHCPNDIHMTAIPGDIHDSLRAHLRARQFESVWYLPTKRMMKEIVRFKPDLLLTDAPIYPNLYAKVYSRLQAHRIRMASWLSGDCWQEILAKASRAHFPTKYVWPLRLFAWSNWLSSSDHILAVCRWLEQVVKRRLPGKETSLLYDCVDPEPWLIKPDSLFPFKRPAVGILQHNTIPLKVNGLLSFADVARRMGDVHFYIAGGGNYTPAVQKAFSGLANTHFVGRLSYPEEVRKFYGSIDVYILASGLDCCPLTVLEASVCGRPTIASRVGGIPELIRQGVTGWTAENGRTDEWVSFISQALKYPKLSRRMGLNARQYVMKHFASKMQASRLASIIRNITE